MKTSLTVIWILLSFTMNSQTESIGQIFKFKAKTKAIFLQQINNIEDVKTLPLNSEVWIDSYVICKISSTADGKILFYTLDFKRINSGEKNFHTDSDSYYNYNDKLFSISSSEYKEATADYTFPDRLNFGIISLPFKFRPQEDLSFSNEFNLNFTVGFLPISLYDTTKFYLQAGFGPGTVDLNSSNSSLEKDKSQSAGTLTAFSGIMVQYKEIQVGLYTGTDWINNNKNYDWDSQGNIWFSVGIGYKILTLSKNEKQQK